MAYIIIKARKENPPIAFVPLPNSLAMPKNLILNADDFGSDNDATNAILELIALDKMHNTTVLANHIFSKFNSTKKR